MLFSTKVFILMSATLFLVIGKISESTWMETVLIVGGLRTAAQVMGQHIESKKVKNDGQN